jgi:hypothetical protein
VIKPPGGVDASVVGDRRVVLGESTFHVNDSEAPIKATADGTATAIILDLSRQLNVLLLGHEQLILRE